MATQYKLTWRPKENRWQKFYKGRRYYFPGLEGKVASYRRCYFEWLALKAKIDGDTVRDNRAAIAESWKPFLNRLREAQQQIIDEYGDTEKTRLIWQELDSFFADQIAGNAIRNGESIRDDVWIDEAGTEIAHQNEDAEAQLEELLNDRLRRLKEMNPQPAKSFFENAGREAPQASGVAPWNDTDSIDTDDLQSLLEAFVESLKAGASDRRGENVRKDVQRYVD